MAPQAMKSLHIRICNLSSLSFLAALVFLFSPTSSKAQFVAAAARPNLVTQNVALSAYSVRRNDPVVASWTIRNTGTGHCPASFTGIYISTSASLPPSSTATPIWTLTTPEIAAGSAVNQAATITIPFDASLGTFYIWVVADDVDNSSLNQTTRSDDAARSPAFAVANTVTRPNLIPQNVVLNATHARPGDSVDVAYTVTNAGNVRSAASLTALRLSTSATTPPATDPLALLIPTPEIPSQTSIRLTNTVTIPGNTALATYYLWVVVDADPNSTVNQSTKADDAARSPALSVVNVIPKPNLLPQNITLSALQARPGDRLSLAWTTTNSGTANCPASITGLHLGTSPTTPPTTDGLNVKVATPAIHINSFVRQTNTVTIPANTPLGTYYLWVISDDVTNSTLNQSSRADDAARSEVVSIVNILRLPNLVPITIVLDNIFARPGDQVEVTWAITNKGNANCPESVTGIHLGTSASVRPNNAALILIETPPITTNSFIRRTNLVTIPANTTLGNYYLWVVADDATNSTLDQSSRADDALPSSSFSVVSTVPRPNLVPQNITLSRYFATAGQQISVAWTITNSGAANCPPSTTGLHIGTSATAPPAADSIDLDVPTPAINAGAFVRQTNMITLPANTTAGTYYLWVIADDVSESTLNQTSRADDAARSAALNIGTLTLASPASGSTVPAPPTFNWTVSGLITPKVYLANKANPVFAVDTIVIFNNSAGTTFTPSLSEWTTAVNALGIATNYYWTLGNSDPAAKQIYADWRPFKTQPGTINPIFLSENKHFRFQLVSPHLPQITIQTSPNLTTWTDFITLQNTSGVVTYTDQTVGSQEKKFFRVKP
jgi:hypothetical protein